MVSSSSNKKKPSASSQPDTAALVTVQGSELDFYTNSNYLAYELPKYAASFSRGKLGNDNLDDDIPGEEEEEEEETEDGEEGSEGSEAEGEGKGRPNLSDIEIVSNEVVLDAANIPSARIVFKVKNSSGVELKAVNVRVEKK
jgi:hypothetical protein